MASQTPIYKLPYPGQEDVPDFASDMQKLATVIDGMFEMTSGGGAYDPIASYATNFTATTTPTRPFAWYQAGPFVSFEIFPVRTGSGLGSGNPSGDLSNILIGTLATQIPPPVNPVFAANIGYGPLAGFALMPDGTFWLCCLAPGGAWYMNEVWNTSFFYMAVI